MSRFSDVVAFALVAAVPCAASSPTIAAAPVGANAGEQATSSSAGAAKRTFGFGMPATAAQIAAWDIDVRPDGTGLPPGRGTVPQGQRIYDEKCASCHGTFGESTDYMAIAGGVGTLGTDQPMRTIGSKLNYVTTLWDYINRAMPFTNPKTLAVDEVYALTAYVLHLNDLLPAEGSLDRASLIAFRMPNRDGFTTDHGMMARDGRPDTANVACMRDCVKEIRLSSEYPDHARDSHGNLAEQSRPLGPVEGTPASGTKSARTSVAQAARAPLDLARQSGCMACHAVTSRVVGPGYREVATRYAGNAGAEAKLADKVRNGGAGTWGTMPMPAQPQLADGDVTTLVRWILGGAK